MAPSINNRIDDETKKELLRLGIYLKNILEKNGVWYCLAVGSLLGAVRHNGFIPWDSDLDFHIKVTDMELVRKIIKENPPEDAYLRIRGINHSTQSHDCLVSLRVAKCHVDLYQLIGVPINQRKRTVFCYLCYFIDMTFRHKYVNLADCKKKNQLKAAFVKTVTHLIPDSLIEILYKKIENMYDFNKSLYVKSLCSIYIPHDCVKKEKITSTIPHKFEDTEFMIPQDYDTYLRHMYGDYMTPVKY